MKQVILGVLMALSTSSFAQVLVGNNAENIRKSIFYCLVDSDIIYDAGYYRLNYPMGDFPADRGCCADLVIRALRLLDQDLQQEVREDVLERPQLNNIKKPDTNIDHRRVYDLWYYFNNNFTRAACKSCKRSIVPSKNV